MEEKFLVTGGAGFIGSHIVEALAKRGKKVRILDNFSTGKMENIEDFFKKYNNRNSLEVIKGDLRDKNTVDNAVKDVDYIFHLGALTSVSRSVEDTITTSEVNIIGTLNILNAAKSSGVKRVIYASSSSAYGDSPKLPKKEEMETNPLSPYAVSKLACEDYCKVFKHLYGLETVILRYFNVFGPRQDPDSQYAAVIPKFIKMVLNNNKPTIYGDGEQTRDFTYIDNVVDANLQALKKNGILGEVFNIACGEKITINRLVKEIGDILNRDVNPIYSEPRKGDVRDSIADISKAKNLLGYKPKIGFRKGLENTVRFFSKKN